MPAVPQSSPTPRHEAQDFNAGSSESSSGGKQKPGVSAGYLSLSAAATDLSAFTWPKPNAVSKPFAP
jgi:hypothetical protein